MKRCALCVVLLSVVLGSSALSAQTFQDVAGSVGLTLDHTVADICPPPLSPGSAWGDYNGDGLVDLMVTNHGAANRLYENQGDTTLDGLPDFVDVAAAVGVDAPLEVSISAVFIDYDNDGDQDLYVSNWDNNQLFENQLIETGTATFTDVTPTAGLADEGRTITSAWGDFDNDGFLDVYLAKHRECPGFENSADRLFRSNGDGTFTDVTTFLCDGCDEIAFGLSFGPGWLDYDNDGDLDLYVVHDAIAEFNSANQLWENQGEDPLNPGDWLFENVSVAAGADQRLNGMGLGIGDIDNDGNLDMAFSNIGPNVLLHNQGDGTFADISASAGIERPMVPTGEPAITWGTIFFDHDNDGDLDLYFVAGNIADLETPLQPNAFFTNNGDLTFTDISDSSGLNSDLRGRNVTTADFDEDGWIDVFDGNFGYPPGLYRNIPIIAGNVRWLQVTVEGTVDNRDGIGTRIWATVPAGVTQMREITSGPAHGGGEQRLAHFGLKGAGSATLKVRWPNGAEQELGSFAHSQRVHIVQELILSAPTPGVAGVPNDLVTTGSDPGGQIVLVMGLQAGTKAIGQCPGVELDIANARRVDRDNSDDIGVATSSVSVPPRMAGRTVLFQAFEIGSCRKSNVVSFDFPAAP